MQRTERTSLVGAYYRWYVLGLATLTFTLVAGMPTMALPVLFPEIAADLGLTIVQVGVVWGMGSLTGIFMGLLGGVIGDRIGAKRTLVMACLLVGLTGALRGLATNYLLLLLSVFLVGLIQPVIPINIHKSCGIWFPGRQLGMANGIVSTGMALGFMLGSLLSATVLSPWLGGWRGVIFFYALIALLFSLAWSTMRAGPAQVTPAIPLGKRPGIWQGLRHVATLKNVWLLGLALFGVGGCIQGLLGYLPSYLRLMGWAGPAADSVLASFHGASMIFAIPIAVLSDRLGARRPLLLVAALMIAAGTGLLAVVHGPWIWPVILLAGMVRDGFMAVLVTQIMEVKGVGAAFAGTATGLVIGCASLASVLAPPVGNSFARFSPSTPFIFWSALALVGFLGFYWLQDEVD